MNEQATGMAGSTEPVAAETIVPSHFEVPAAEDAASPAWEEVAAGRFMPRRFKGSCKGRSLG